MPVDGDQPALEELMEFWTSVKVIVRRWYLVIPCLILTVVVGLYLVKHVKATYQASGSVLLAGSGHAPHAETASTVAGVNPYANMDQSQLSYLVSQSAASTSFQEQMTQAGAIGSYAVTAIPGEPAMTVTLSAPTPQQAMSSYRELVSLLNAHIDLKQRTAGAPANTLVGVQDWTSPTSAVAVNAAKVKALILVVVVGVLLTLGLTFLVDALLANGVPWKRAIEDEDHEQGDDEGDDDEELRRGPVAVPVHLDLDDELIQVFAGDGELNDEDRAYEAALAGEPTVRSASRYDIVKPLLLGRDSGPRSSEDRQRGTLPPWVPPEARTRASGS